MEREANYFVVGSFVLLVLVMGVLFIYWYSTANSHADYTHYEIYFDGSVSGLTTGSPVRYLGVDVGQVQRIRIDPRSANRVQIIIDIQPSTPVSASTVAELSLQGVTGLLYIDLEQQGENAGGRRLLSNVPSEHYPVIPSVHSNFDLFLSSLPDLTGRLDDLVDRASRLLSDPNIDAVGRIAVHLDRATAGLPQTARNADELIAQLRDTLTRANQVIADVHTASQSASVDFVAAVRRLRTTSDNLARTSARLDAFVAANSDQLGGLVRDGVPQIEGLLRDSRAAVQQINDLAHSLRDDPSRLLYQPPRTGVSIPP
ncbi:MAG TPA: MlaD family protein [Steroidobacteraceae bacterium]|jgi:phospholipid/cholesterol/gamma-HCH transport system substrate-binding protein|nr:MlaD family protein [Steroidobacteraceae bacterium]